MAMLVFLEGLQGLLGLFKRFLAVCLRGLTPMGLAYGLPGATRKKKKRKKVFSTLFQRNKRKRKNNINTYISKYLFYHTFVKSQVLLVKIFLLSFRLKGEKCLTSC